LVKSFTMPLDSQRVVTLKDVAARAGLSLATVSYALRHHSKIPATTREKVAAVAHALGYRPNPRISSLMAHIRGAQARPHAERIAFVWVHTTRRAAQRDPFMRLVFDGAKQRADRAGFALEECWTNDAGMTDRRLQDILQARGITGVVLSPVMTAESSLALDWDWNFFAAAVIGNVAWTPELHHAGHHHYLAMRMAMLELAKLGRTRPAAIIDRATSERAKHAWEAGFLVNHPLPSRARSLLRVVKMDEPAPLAAWLRESKADALIVSTTDLLQVPGVREVCRRGKLPLVTLYWSANTPTSVGGIDQRYDRVAAHAVDLVVAQLNNNERGPPDLPSMMLFPGRWVAP
jgi:LacI family transcriptional regulator